MLSFIRDLFTSSEKSMLADASVPLNREEEDIQIELDSSIGNPPWLDDDFDNDFEYELLKYERLHAIDGLVAICTDIQEAAVQIEDLGVELLQSLNRVIIPIGNVVGHPRNCVERLSWAIEQLSEMFDDWETAIDSVESINDHNSGASYSFLLSETSTNLSEIPETDGERLEHFYPGSYSDLRRQLEV